MGIEPDRIDLATVVGCDLAQAWDAVSEPGWFINDGALAEHEVEWSGDVARVVDPSHGTFEFTRVERREPDSITFASEDTEGNARQVRFELAATESTTESGTVVRVTESGFAAAGGSTSDRVAQHTQNTRTWIHQLELLQQHLGS